MYSNFSTRNYTRVSVHDHAIMMSIISGRFGWQNLVKLQPAVAAMLMHC